MGNGEISMNEELEENVKPIKIVNNFNNNNKRKYKEKIIYKTPFLLRTTEIPLIDAVKSILNEKSRRKAILKLVSDFLSDYYGGKNET